MHVPASAHRRDRVAMRSPGTRLEHDAVCQYVSLKTPIRKSITGPFALDSLPTCLTTVSGSSKFEVFSSHKYELAVASRWLLKWWRLAAWRTGVARAWRTSAYSSATGGGHCAGECAIVGRCSEQAAGPGHPARRKTSMGRRGRSAEFCACSNGGAWVFVANSSKNTAIATNLKTSWLWGRQSENT